MPSAASLLIIAALVIVNGLFVAAEFALLGVPHAKVETKAGEGHRVARLLRILLRNTRKQDQYIATAQLGITLASLGLGGYGEHVLAHGFEYLFQATGAAAWIAVHGVSTVLAVCLLTYLHIVFGEMIPKSLALQEPWKTAKWVVPAMKWLTRLTYPAVITLNGAGNLILKAMGIRRAAEETHGQHSAEELQYIVQESQEGGKLTAEAGKLLQEVFDFDALLAREVLVPRVRSTGIPLGAGPEELRRLFKKNPHTRYPVYRETIDKIIGMLHVQDIFALIRAGRTVDEAVIRKVPFVPESASLNQVLEAMRKESTQLCVILDEFGGTEGIITLSDLFKEVIGKVPEGVLQVGEIIRDGQGRFLVAGTARLEELGEWAELELDHEEVDTVSGLVLDLLGRPPLVNDRVEYGGMAFRVTSTDGLGVRWCEATRSPG
ncbi:MAG: hypothetical protein JWP91_3869 [Fibrobacteres bacterium]|nr:hypothetical protein [Fibrobacterota bacterium]